MMVCLGFPELMPQVFSHESHLFAGILRHSKAMHLVGLLTGLDLRFH